MLDVGIDLVVCVRLSFTLFVCLLVRVCVMYLIVDTPLYCELQSVCTHRVNSGRVMLTPLHLICVHT